MEGGKENEVGIVKSVRTKDTKFKVGDVVVRVDPRYYRPTEVETLLGDPTMAKEKLGWEPETSFDELVREMTEHDLNIARRDAYLKSEGFDTPDYKE